MEAKTEILRKILASELKDGKFNVNGQVLNLSVEGTTGYLVESKSKQILGAGCVFKEPKFVHECSNVGHVFNLIGNPEHRYKLLKELSSYSRSSGCYKCILDIDPNEVKGYKENTKFKVKDLRMTATPQEVEIKLKSSFNLREMEAEDLEKGYLKLLEQLTTVGNVDLKTAQKTFERRSLCQNMSTLVIEDTTEKKIVGTATLFTLEYTSEGVIGHIEDVVVDKNCRGQGLGKITIKGVLKWAKDKKCDKIILNCSEKKFSILRKMRVHEDRRGNERVL
mmetsp:Transcript_3640/g.5415  ORF Transcript_3640/g.5415 Transcript_3640/m.5415 type:complete len:279 (+) Transcript_3640:74-910(+)